MALLEKKQQLSQEGLKGKPEKAPPQKEKKKDISAFKGKPYLKGEEIREELRKEEAYKILRLPREERVKLEAERFERKKFGEFIDQKEIEKVVKELRKKESLERDIAKKFAIRREREFWEKKYLGK